MYQYTLISCKHTLTQFHCQVLSSIRRVEENMEVSVGGKALPAAVTGQQMWSLTTKMLPICPKQGGGAQVADLPKIPVASLLSGAHPGL